MRPGDSLRAEVETTLKYDYDHNLIATKYSILKIIDILKSNDSDQLNILA